METSRRAAVVVGLVTLSLVLMITRLAQMELMEHDVFLREAVAQRFYTVRQDAPRGEILDRNGTRLATSRPGYRLYLLYPAYVDLSMLGPAPSLMLVRLAAMLGLDPGDLDRRVREKIAQRRFFEPFLVKEDLLPREVALLTEMRTANPGIYLDAHPVRDYPLGDLAAHLLGHLGPVDRAELAAAMGQGYEPGDQIGKMGLELQYDRLLRGTPGLIDLEVDASFRPTNHTIQRSPSRPGATIRTTLDAGLQETVQRALGRTLDYVRTHPDWNGDHFPHTDAGAAVVLDVNTGGILAMASYPAFDPNVYAGYRGDAAEATIRKLEASHLFPMWNRAIRSEYLPGSTWKMLSAAAALEHGVISTSEEILCTGVYDKLEPKLDWKPEGHGKVNVVSALAQSCNIYFYEMGFRLGVENLAETARQFGFGAPLGVDLPGETSGWIPDEARRKADPDPSSWSGGKLLSAAIGQGPTATPLQLAHYAAVLANGGTKVHPHVLSAVLDGEGRVVQDLTPPPDGQVGLDPRYMRALVDGMKAVTEWGTSTGAFAGMPFKVAGKTGTAEVTGTANCEGDLRCQYGVYVAFAPADNPAIAIAVVGERAGHGDSMNPVARAAIARYFNVTLASDDPLYEAGIFDRPASRSPGRA